MDAGRALREAPRMFRTLLMAFVLLLSFACGGSKQHPVDGPNDHHEAGHEGEHKHAHGKGVHKHKHGGDDDHSKHRHGADPIGHRFENAEEWAKRFDDPERVKWQMPAKVVELMEIEAGMQVADIGAGTGYFLPYLAAKTGATGAVHGLDIEAGMVDYMKERAAREKLVGVVARVVAMDDPQLEPASLDRVLVVDTWHHLPERVAYAKKVTAGLKPGGTLTIVDFTMETERGPPKKHRLTAESIIEELREAGLTPELLTEPLPDQYIIRAKKAE